MKDQTTFYSDIRQILQNARNRTYSEINRAMVEAYWIIGKRIVEEEQEGFDCHEPPHVHIRRERMTCKFWLEPVVLSTNHGFSPHELNRIRAIILDHQEYIKEAWHEHCSE